MAKEDFDPTRDAAFIEVQRQQREDVRRIEVRDLGREPYERGLAQITIEALGGGSTQTLRMNPRELNSLRLTIDAYLAGKSARS